MSSSSKIHQILPPFCPLLGPNKCQPLDISQTWIPIP